MESNRLSSGMGSTSAPLCMFSFTEPQLLLSNFTEHGTEGGSGIVVGRISERRTRMNLSFHRSCRGPCPSSQNGALFQPEKKGLVLTPLSISGPIIASSTNLHPHSLPIRHMLASPSNMLLTLRADMIRKFRESQASILFPTRAASESPIHAGWHGDGLQLWLLSDRGKSLAC